MSRRCRFFDLEHGRWEGIKRYELSSKVNPSFSVTCQ